MILRNKLTILPNLDRHTGANRILSRQPNPVPSGGLQAGQHSRGGVHGDRPGPVAPQVRAAQHVLQAVGGDGRVAVRHRPADEDPGLAHRLGFGDGQLRDLCRGGEGQRVSFSLAHEDGRHGNIHVKQVSGI